MIIGLHGLRGSGKDTVCQIIQGLVPDTKRVAFADPLKILAARALGYEGTDAELLATMEAFKDAHELEVLEYGVGNHPLPISSLSGREFLQNLGQGARTTFGEEFWIEKAVGQVFSGQRPPRVVFTDVRLTNEAYRIKTLLGEIWHIDRSVAETPHITEQKLPDDLIDKHIDNNGTLEELAVTVKTLL